MTDSEKSIRRTIALLVIILCVLALVVLVPNWINDKKNKVTPSATWGYIHYMNNR